MKKLILLGLTLATSSLLADVTFTVFQGGFENDAGTPTNGMSYGFIVSTADSSFDFGNYTSWDLGLNGQFLSNGSGATDDWFVYGGTQGSGQTAPQTVFFPPAASNGGIGAEPGVLEINISSSDPFALVWFPTNSALAGATYGAATDANFLIPPSGNTNLSPGTLNKVVGFTVAVPEPGTYAAVFGILGLGLVMWRRLR